MAEIAFKTFSKRALSSSSEYEKVMSLASDLKKALEAPAVSAEIEAAHTFGASSHRIQEVISPILIDMGFASEKKGLFADIKVPGIRPDFYKPLDNGGIIVEVERGKTIANNMDLLDVWKTHICQSANHLILLVPQIRVNKTGGQQKIFPTVLNRVGAFFEEGTEPIDVDSVHVLGY